MSNDLLHKFKDLKILIVDDLATIRNLLLQSLNQLGFLNIEQAGDGDLAFNCLNNQHIDLLITDWSMPNMSGIELIKAVRSDPKLKYLKILMVTTNNEKSQIEEAKSAGADGYLIKPFNIKMLEDHLLNVLV